MSEREEDRDDDDYPKEVKKGKEEDEEEEEDRQGLSCCLRPWKRTHSGYSMANKHKENNAISPPGLPKQSDDSPVCLRMTPILPIDLPCLVANNNKVPIPPVVTQIDYVNFFIPHLRDIVNCPFYFGKIDRYEAESLMDNKPEGSFLLRDSAQEEFVFSVSFRRYNRSLHARIEESNHRFSFDSHDPGVHSSSSVSGLLEYYKEPLSCMFFEPMLIHPVNRSQCFTLQELARCVVCDNCTYDGVSLLPLPRTLKDFLREYNYKHKIRSRQIDLA